ncbi:MAG: type II toxin-antitoxin system MqsA family antitoxin [bacterium]|nr:type II toxin-antitoxin system MqsA family antitoxin [bacterium]
MKRYDDCSFCGGKVLPQRVKVDYWWKGDLTIIENVPAGVCQQCGEEYYDGPIAEEMEHLVKSKEVIRTISIPVKEYKEAVFS